MLQIVLYQPEIPPNTGNIIRLSANIGARLHLIRPLGFSMTDARLRRAGLDYGEIAEVAVHEDWPACRAALGKSRIFALTTRGGIRYDQPRFDPNDALLFGAEPSGLPAEILAEIDAGRRLRLPMAPGNRSLNLSNAVAAVAFEAWRQLGFPGS